MLVYEGIKSELINDVNLNAIVNKIYDKFLLGISNEKFYIDGIDCIINNSVMEGLK